MPNFTGGNAEDAGEGNFDVNAADMHDRNLAEGRQAVIWCSYATRFSPLPSLWGGRMLCPCIHLKIVYLHSFSLLRIIYAFATNATNITSSSSIITITAATTTTPHAHMNSERMYGQHSSKLRFSGYRRWWQLRFPDLFRPWRKQLRWPDKHTDNISDRSFNFLSTSTSANLNDIQLHLSFNFSDLQLQRPVTSILYINSNFIST